MPRGGCNFQEPEDKRRELSTFLAQGRVFGPFLPAKGAAPQDAAPPRLDRHAQTLGMAALFREGQR